MLLKTIKRWLPFVLFLLFVCYIILSSNLGHPWSIVNWVNMVPGGDKCAHAILIGTLAFSLNYALVGRTVRIGRCQILLGCLIVAVSITVEEFSQIWIPSRTFDLGDLASNYFGIAFASWLWINRISVPF